MNTYDGHYSLETFWSDIQCIDEFYRLRSNYIIDYMQKDLDINGASCDITLCSDDIIDLKINTLEICDFSGKWKGSYFSCYPIHLTYIPRDGQVFTGWYMDGKCISNDQELVLTEINSNTVIEIRTEFASK